MRLPKRYLRRVVVKRLIEFFLINLFILLIIIGNYTRSGTGILYQFGDDWYIDSSYRHNHSYSRYYTGIGNPDSFPHVLVSENNNTEVYFSLDTYTAFIGPLHFPLFIRLNSLELLSDFMLKQSIFYICIILFIALVFTYFFLNRKKFQFTNKLLG